MLQLEKGWRRCATCQVLVREGSAPCPGGGSHETRSSHPYQSLFDPGEGTVQQGWQRCQQCNSLFYPNQGPEVGGGVCPQGGGAHTMDDPQHLPTYAALLAPYPEAEGSWQWCTVCGSLWSYGHGPTRCAGGAEHDGTGSAAYWVIRRDAGLQTGWAQCQACQALVSSDVGSTGCLEGAEHRPGLTAVVTFGGDREGAQPGWRMCTRCHSMVYAVTSPGVCRVPDPAGGPAVHAFSDGLPYAISRGLEPADELTGWRLCAACQQLVYTGYEAAACPAGDVHDVAASSAYSVLAGDDQERGGMFGYRCCRKCRSLVLGVLSAGHCRDGTQHDLTGSLAYLLPDGQTTLGVHAGWYWCRRCQAVVQSGGGGFGGMCFDNAPHDYTESRFFGLPTDFTPDPGQGGWEMCGVCNQAVLTDDGAAAGLCVGAAAHHVGWSQKYTLAVQPAPPPVDAGPALAVAPTETGLAVSGTRFTPRGEDQPQLSVRLSADDWEQEVALAPDGSFALEVAGVAEAPAGGVLLLGRDDRGLSARLLLTEVVPVQAPRR